MTASTPTTSPPVRLSAQAHQKALEFVELGLYSAIRMGVRGGGCSGFTYLLTMDDPQDGDIVWEQDGVRLALAADALPYLQGATLNWKDSLMEGGFEFDNPNAVAACGCGSSFKVIDSDGCESAV